MDEGENATKVYCEKCDSVFGSKAEYERHFDSHTVCESCPIDTVIGRIVGFFRK